MIYTCALWRGSFRTLYTKYNIKFCSTISTSTNSAQQNEQQLKLAFDQFKNESGVEETNPLVIVHGLFGQKHNWRSIAKAIQKQLGDFVFTVDMVFFKIIKIN
jgi:hypothetical protein